MANSENMSVVWTWFKPFARGLMGVATILSGCFMAGWGGAWGLQTIFETQISRADLRTDVKIVNSENKILGIQNANFKSLEGQMGILIDLNKTLLIRQGIPLPKSARENNP